MSFALPTGWPGRLLALGILLIVASIVWFGAVSPLAGFYRDRADALAQRRVLAEKMADVAAMLPRLQADAATRSNAADPLSLLLAGASDALAEAGLQEALTRAARTTDVVLLSTEATPARNVGAVRRIGLKIDVTGKYSSLVGFIARIDQSTPPLLMDELQFQGLAHQEGARSQIRLTVYGFRAGGQGT
jgi:Tfp pilus assembly protein PilO